MYWEIKPKYTVSSITSQLTKSGAKAIEGKWGSGPLSLRIMLLMLRLRLRRREMFDIVRALGGGVPGDAFDQLISPNKKQLLVFYPEFLIIIVL